MEYKKLYKDLPKTKRNALIGIFIDMLLESENANSVPPYLAKTILYNWQKDTLTSHSGFSRLLESLKIVEPKKLSVILSELEI